MDENHIIAEVFDSETFPVEHKRANNKRQYLFSNYRVEIMKDKQGLGDKAAYIALGQKHSGNTFKKIIGQVTDSFKVLATIVQIVEEFTESTYGKSFDGFSIVLPKQSTERHIRLVKRILKRKLMKRYSVLDSDYTFDNTKRIWVIRKGMNPSEVFNGKNIEPGAFDNADVDTKDPEDVDLTPAPNPFAANDMAMLAAFQDIYSRLSIMTYDGLKSSMEEVKLKMVDLKSAGVIGYGEKLLGFIQQRIDAQDTNKEIEEANRLKEWAGEYLEEAKSGTTKERLQFFIDTMSRWVKEYNGTSDTIRNLRFFLIDTITSIRDILDQYEQDDNEESFFKMLDDFQTQVMPHQDVASLEMFLDLLHNEWWNQAKTIKARARLGEIEDAISDMIEGLKKADFIGSFNPESHIALIDKALGDMNANLDSAQISKIKEVGVGLAKAYADVDKAVTTKEKVDAYRDFMYYYNRIAKDKISVSYAMPGMLSGELGRVKNKIENSWDYDFDDNEVDATVRGTILFDEIGYNPKVLTPLDLRTKLAQVLKVSTEDTEAITYGLYHWAMGEEKKKLQAAVSAAKTKKAWTDATIRMNRFNDEVYINLDNNVDFKNQLKAFLTTGAETLPSKISLTLHNYLNSIRADIDTTPIRNYIRQRINTPITPKDNNLGLDSMDVKRSIARGGMSPELFETNVNKLNNLVNGKIPEITFHKATADRAWADTRGGEYLINTGDNFTDVTCWHEMGHHVENYNPNIKRAADLELQRRHKAAEKPKVRKLRDITGHTGYKAREVAINNWAMAAYESKIYTTEKGVNRYKKVYATELVSMGLQYLAPSSSKVDILAARHPEYLKFIMGVIAMLQD